MSSMERIVHAFHKMASPLTFFGVIAMVFAILEQSFLIIVPITWIDFDIGFSTVALFLCYSSTLLAGLQAGAEFRDKVIRIMDTCSQTSILYLKIGRIQILIEMSKEFVIW